MMLPHRAETPNSELIYNQIEHYCSSWPIAASSSKWVFLFVERAHTRVPLPVLWVALGRIKIFGPRRLNDAMTQAPKPNGQAATPFSCAIMEIFAAGVSSLTDLPNKGDTHGRLSDPDKADSRIGDTTRERNESRSGLVQPE